MIEPDASCLSKEREQSRGWNWIPKQHKLHNFEQPTKKTSHSFFDVMIEPDALPEQSKCKAEDGIGDPNNIHQNAKSNTTTIRPLRQ
jgi:hypothetical protein